MKDTARKIMRLAKPGSSSPPSYLWTVEGGNVIPASGRTGIARRSPASVISPSELPDGVAGSGVIIVPAWPIPMGLPNGIGVVSRSVSGSPLVYSFFRIDGSNPYGGQDISTGESLFATNTSNIDKVSGPMTWRYVCLSGPYGYY